MIKTVKLRTIDTSCHGSGGRILSVQVKGKSNFETPTRPISIPEFKAKQFLAFRGTLNGHLGAEQIDLKGERFARFMKMNGTVKRVRRTLTKFADLTCCFENFPIFDVPALSPDSDVALKLILEMQLRIPTLNYISLPPIQTANEHHLEKLISNWNKDAEQYGKGVVPQIYMNEEVGIFRKKLRMLSQIAASGEIQIVNLIYANPDSYPHQFVEIWNNREINAILNCSGVPRGGKEVATGLYESPAIELQRYGIDAFTRRTQTPSIAYIQKLQFQKPPTSIEEIQDFHWPIHRGGAILEKDLWFSLPSKNVECKCKVCKGKDQEEIRNTYCIDQDGEIVSVGMEKASRLHDAVTSQREYDVMRSRINSNEMADYVAGVIKYRDDKLRL